MAFSYHKSYASLGHKPKRRWWRHTPAIATPLHTRYETRRRTPRMSFVLIALGVVLGAWMGVLFFHPYFRIRHISVTGTSNISPAALQETVTTALTRKRWRFLPYNNFFLLDKKRITTVLKTKYPIETVTITMHFPNTVALTVTERLAFVIYDDGEQYTLVDEEGIPQKTLRAVLVHERREQRVGESGTVTSTVHYPDTDALNARFGTYPVLYTKRKEKIDPVVIKNTITAYKFLHNNTDFATHHFTYPQTYQTLEIVHREGMTVAFNPFEKLDEQLETFRQAWQRELRKERTKAVYVNARYPGRVYLEVGGTAAPPKTSTQ